MPAWQDFDLWVRLCERFGSGVRIDARTYVQHAEHGGERISSPQRIEKAHALFVDKHAHLLDEKSLVSLELLMCATAHRPFGLKDARRFAAAGFPARTFSAILSDRVPLLRGAARKLGSLKRTKR
jgi:hypothetical protein